MWVCPRSAGASRGGRGRARRARREAWPTRTLDMERGLKAKHSVPPRPGTRLRRDTESPTSSRPRDPAGNARSSSRDPRADPHKKVKSESRSLPKLVRRLQVRCGRGRGAERLAPGFVLVAGHYTMYMYQTLSLSRSLRTGQRVVFRNETTIRAKLSRNDTRHVSRRSFTLERARQHVPGRALIGRRRQESSSVV